VIFDSLLIDGIDDLRVRAGREDNIEHRNREINNQQSPTNRQSEITKSLMFEG
jgi:hypothetical protein